MKYLFSALSVLCTIFLLWLALSFVEVNAKNLNSEPTSTTNAFYIISEIATETA